MRDDPNHFCSLLKITSPIGPFLGEKLGGVSFTPWPTLEGLLCSISEDPLTLPLKHFMLIGNIQRINTGTWILWVAGHYSSKPVWGDDFLCIGDRRTFTTEIYKSVWGRGMGDPSQGLEWVAPVFIIAAQTNKGCFLFLSGTYDDGCCAVCKQVQSSGPLTQNCQFGF